MSSVASHDSSRTGRGPSRAVAAGAALAIFAGVVLYIAGFGLFGIHVGGLQAPADVRRADGIVVLTGGRQRIAAAIDLLQSGKGKRLLISGVNPVTDRAALQTANGAAPMLFSCCVDIDRAALDTIGNAEESAKWLRDHGYSSAIVVTSNYHIPRTLLEMRRAVPGVDLIAFPVVNTRYGRLGWLANPDAIRVFFTEYSKFVGAMVRGIIDATPRNSAEAEPLAGG